MNPNEYQIRRNLSLEDYGHLAEFVEARGMMPPFLNSGFLFDDLVDEVDDNSLPYVHLLKYVDPTDKEILEVGCGFGRGCHFIKNQYNVKSVVGCDINKKLLTVGSKHFQNVELIEGNAVELQLLNRLFDIVLTIETVLYWDCHPNSFDSFASVIREGGSLLIASDFRRSDTTIDNKFRQSGLRLIAECDITNNVLASIEKAIRTNRATPSDFVKQKMFQTKYRCISKHYVRE